MTVVQLNYSSLKEKAINLRKQGLSYSEILKQIPVAKSTISLWLRSVNLSKRNKQRLTTRRLEAALKGGEVRKNTRILATQKIYKEAVKDIDKISKHELWLMGVMLYWAEGSKEKETHPGSGVQFSNSDPYMIKLFLKWLLEICNINRNEIYFDIFIHENSKNNLDNVLKHWSQTTNFTKNHFPHIYFKKNKLKTNRKNIGNNYYGLVKIRVKSSSVLNRKIAGWIKGVIKYFQ